MGDNKELQKIPVLRDWFDATTNFERDKQTEAYWRFVWRFELAARAIK